MKSKIIRKLNNPKILIFIFSAILIFNPLSIHAEKFADQINDYEIINIIDQDELDDLNMVDIDSMELRITNKWHGGSANPNSDRNNTFNGKCPVLTPPYERAIAGCTAVAIAQIMNYWEWPEHGEGIAEVVYESKRFTKPRGVDLDFNPFLFKDNPDNNGDGEPDRYAPRQYNWPWWNGRLFYKDDKLWRNGYWDDSLVKHARQMLKNLIHVSDEQEAAFKQAIDLLFPPDMEWDENIVENVNFAQETYNWDLMKNKWTKLGQYTNEVEEAMSTLCYHASAALDMYYGIKASSKGTKYAATALRDHFFYYIDGINVLERETESFEEYIIEEIQWLRPVVYGSFGHNWVCHGYNITTGKFLMNMGWSGGKDGWYRTDEKIGSDIPDNSTSMTYGLAPKNVFFIDEHEIPSTYGDGSPNNPFYSFGWAYHKVQSGEIPADSTLIVKAGQEINVAPDTVLKGPFTIRGHRVTLISGSNPPEIRNVFGVWGVSASIISKDDPVEWRIKLKADGQTVAENGGSIPKNSIFPVLVHCPTFTLNGPANPINVHITVTANNVQRTFTGEAWWFFITKIQEI